MKLSLDEQSCKPSSEMQQLRAFTTSDFKRLGREDNSAEEPPPAYPAKDPVEMVTDYLTEVRKHVFKEIELQYGEALFQSLRRSLVITVPAVWSERAKDLTVQAVRKSGWKTDLISLVTEPECGAIYTLRWMITGANSQQVSVGDRFVLSVPILFCLEHVADIYLDAMQEVHTCYLFLFEGYLGLTSITGGTVDLISFRVTDIKPSLRIEEAAIGTGDKCGAAFVDRAFLLWLKGWIGAERFNRIPNEKLRHGSQFMNAFEILKQQFTGSEDGMLISLPRECGIEDDEALAIDDRTLAIIV
jgi:hypothetical protein